MVPHCYLQQLLHARGLKKIATTWKVELALEWPIAMDKREGSQRQEPSLTLQTFQIPECPVCWDSFNDSLHVPRMLRCGHTICQWCLDHLLIDAGLGQRCVRCPECRSLCMWRVIHELPKNYILLRLLGPSSFENRRSSKSLTYFATAWQKVSWIYALNFVASWLPRLVERKVREVGKLVWAVVVMTVLLPLSLIHLVLSCWTAFLGAIIFTWVSLGGIGIAVSMLFGWCIMGVGCFVKLTFHSLFHWRPGMWSSILGVNC